MNYEQQRDLANDWHPNWPLSLLQGVAWAMRTGLIERCDLSKLQGRRQRHVPWVLHEAKGAQ